MHKNDVTVNVGRAVDPLHYEEICDDLLSLDGIYAAAHHHDRPQLVTVEYDPHKLNSLVILDRVRWFALEADFDKA